MLKFHLNPARTRLFTMLLAVATAATIHAQVYKLHNADVAVEGTGEFTTTLTSNSSNVQSTTDTVGFLFTLRDHPVSWAGVEFNYGYEHYSQRYSYPATFAPIVNGSIGAGAHEATAAYLFHPHFRHLQPFVGIGGGALDFIPGQGANQWRYTGLLETGLDIPTHNPHFGFRVQGRSLIYRAPNFSNSQISSRSWVVTTQPAAGVYIRF